ncbi:Hypothetical predicted protein [Paramuricea clavata]|uniref:Uncharacterized protein n=1 Tax=Paramuricea clavata TaxID=317549 RepID=A0A7D9I6D5_PARCT|nr:Hypothetical predicted protein [Paramuricea clavata]
MLVNNDVGVKDDDAGKEDGGEDCNAPPTQSTINLDESTLENNKGSMYQSFSEAETDNEMTQNPKDSTVQELNAELNELSQQSVFEPKISEFEDEVKIKLASLRTDFGLPPNSNLWQTMTAVEAQRLTAENANLKQKLCLAEQQNQAQSQEILILKEEKASLLTSLRLCCGDNALKVETKTDKPTMQNAPAEIAIHCGTNDLRIKEPKAIAESLIKLAKVVQMESTKVSISELITRADADLKAKAKATNKP